MNVEVSCIFFFLLYSCYNVNDEKNLFGGLSTTLNVNIERQNVAL